MSKGIIRKNKQGKLKLFVKIVSYSFIIGILLIMLLGRIYLMNTSGELTIINKSSEVVALAEVIVCNQVMQLKMIEINASKKCSFRITVDAQYYILVEFASGRKLTTEIGYVTSGIDVEDTIIITDDDISLDREVKRDEEKKNVA